MSFPTIPAGLPSSCVVLDHFSKFIKRFPFASVAADCHLHFFGYLLLVGVPRPEATLILRRAEFPL